MKNENEEKFYLTNYDNAPSEFYFRSSKTAVKIASEFFGKSFFAYLSGDELEEVVASGYIASTRQFADGKFYHYFISEEIKNQYIMRCL